MKGKLVLVVIVAIAAAGGGWYVVSERQERQARAAALATAESFLLAWEDEDWTALDALAGGAGAGEAHEAAHTQLRAERLRVAPGELDLDEAVAGQAAVDFTATWSLSGLGEWTHEGRLPVAEADGEWLVDWSPAVIHPRLVEGGTLQARRVRPDRAPILDRDGGVLVGGGDVVVVGLEPQRMDDPEEVVEAVVTHAGATAEQVEGVIDRADRPDWFYPIVRMPRSSYDAVRDELQPVPGLVFQEERGRVAASPAIAAVVGGVAEATAEQLEELGDAYEAGDEVGQSGLERAFEARLSGEPGGEIRVVDADGDVVEVLHQVEPVEPEPIRITLDPDLQDDAAAAIADAPNPGALVAVDVGSGEIRALANNPATGFNRALSGRYPPGSTFKVVTAAAALANGTGADDDLQCPQTTTIGGRTFRNAGERDLGAVTLIEAFAESCNTTFTELARDLPDGTLVDMARRFGFAEEGGAGTFPPPDDDVDLVASAIGQGRVTTTPVHLAGVAAAVARGQWQAPRVVLEDEPPPSTEPLPDAVLGPLRQMMRAVVTEGTGVAAGVDEQDVRGKTGTAEYGDGDPPETHAWFIGYRGDLAFAVLVEDSESGGAVAAPVAADFLRRVGG